MKNQRGISLLEVIASISLFSIILLMLNSFHLFSQKQMISQAEEIQNQSNTRIALNVITKELRTAENVIIQGDELVINQTDTYKHVSNTITKNNVAYIKNIKKFTFAFDEDEEKKINIFIESLPSKEEKALKLSTSIYIRN